LVLGFEIARGAPPNPSIEMSSTSNTEQQVAMAIDKTEQEASSVLKEQATAQAVAQAAQVPFSERLPSIEDTLQMARLAAVVYDENPIKSYKDAAKSKDTTSYKTSLVDEGGTDTEMWFYECEEVL
jgi:plasmid replication initiation protein